ncbi:MAG: hypothetical protein JO072_00190 [Parafilimonas sp.]|nr:hypothetical protein [Parafilimonas sp.]
MNNKTANIFYFLLPLFLLACLMTIALINYPIVFYKAKETVITVFTAIIIYVLLWTFIKPDAFSRNGGLLIGFLFIANISIEEFIDWQTKTGTLVSTLSMMFLIFISFSIISGIRTFKTQNILQGIKSSFFSSLLGTLIALCFGFLIDFVFSNRMVHALTNYPGFKNYNDPKAFTFYNSFDNASNHVIIAPIVSIIMGTLGGAIALIVLRLRNRK